jgi:hypothetical protein
MMKGKQNPYKEHFGTSLPRIRDKIEYETKTQDVPFASIFVLRHRQKILLRDARVLRIDVNRRVIYPGATSSVIVRFQSPHLE